MRLPAVRRTPLVRLGWRLHRFWYRATGGRLFSRLNLPVLLLTTTGRKTGKERTWPLYYLDHGSGWIVIASNAGEDTHPAWLLNVRANPRATVQIGNAKTGVVAREAAGSERDALWERAKAASGEYAVYEERTTREIPVVILEPASEVGALVAQ